MKKKLLALIMTAICIFSFSACGGGGAPAAGGDDKDANAWPRELEGDYIFEDGKYQNHSFMIDVPEGWVLHESGCNDTRMTLYRSESDDDYAYNEDAKLEINVDEFKLMTGDVFAMDSRVQNDTQFYVDDTPAAVEDATLGNYTGKKLSGVSSSFKDCNIEHYNLEYKVAGTDNGSKMDIDTYAYDDEQKAEIDAMIQSMVVLVEPPQTEEGEAATGGDSIVLGEGGTVEIVLPEGWYIDGEPTDHSVTLKNDKFGSGYVDIDINTFAESANDQCEKIKGNFGGQQFDTLSAEYNGIAYVGFNPSDSMSEYFADLSDGTVLEVSSMFLHLDQAEDLLNAITAK